LSDPTAEAAAVVVELAQRFQRGDSDAARQLYDPRLRIEQPASLPHGGWHDGLDGMAAMAGTFAEHWDREIAGAEVLGCGPERAVQLTTQTWTSKATGRAATVDVVELFRIESGRVAEIRVFQQDTAALLATLDGTA
jgi:hypothetical protein